VYIKTDGSIGPQILPIQRVGDTYTFTGNITNYTIEVQRSNIVLDGAEYTLQGNGTGKGIVLTNTTNVTIKNVALRNLRMGIYLNQSSSNTITQNDITSTEVGVFLDSSSNNDIDKNNITGNSQGIVLIEFSNYNNIAENRITENGFSGILLEFANNHTSDYNNIVGNNVTSNGVFGMRISSSSNCRIEGNNIANSEYGIELSGSACKYNGLVGNWIINCSRYGIAIGGDVNHNTIVENTIAISQIGVDIFASNNNEFYRNNFIQNTIQVNNGYVEDNNISIGASKNTWNHGSEGNYWSDYKGTDSDKDGIGDTPYVIDADNTDRYPLTKPIGLPEIMSFEEAIQAANMHNFGESFISYSLTGEPEGARFVDESGTSGYLMWLAPNGTLYEAEYPTGRALREIGHTFAESGWDSPEGYYIWALRYSDGEVYWVLAGNGTIVEHYLPRGGGPAAPESAIPIEVGYALIAVIVVALGAIVGYSFLKRKKPRSSTENGVTDSKM
jgi:parallel beta-helix repeat protein